MKRIIYTLLIFAISFSFLNGQNVIPQKYCGNIIPEKLLTRINVEFNNTLQEILESISERHSLIFNYNSNELNLSKKIKHSSKNTSIFKVLLDVLSLSRNKLILTNNNKLLIVPAINEKAELSGLIKSAVTNETLQGVAVIIKDLYVGTVSNENGSFVIKNLAPGYYTVEINYLGYETKIITDILLESNENKLFVIKLNVRELKLDEIIVTPGHYTIKGAKPFASQVLLKKDIQNFNIGEDIYRAVNQLPGVSTNDFSAKFNIRGGESDEVLVLFDGLELHEPFHLKDFIGGLMSIIDLNVIGNVSLLTGGFPAEYGHRMSGVFNINSLENLYNKDQLSVGLSIMNAKIASTGSFNNNQGSWLFTARKGYIDILANMLGEEDFPSVNYYDIYGNVKYKLNNHHKLSLNLLYSYDNLDYIEKENDFDELKTGYSSTYFWLNLNSIITKDINVQTVISFGNVNSKRNANVYNQNFEEYSADLSDKRKFDYLGIKQNWSIDINNSFMIKTGFDFNFSYADYDYDSYNKIYFWDNELVRKSIEETNLITLKPDGGRYSFYLTGKFNIAERLTTEAGLRYDQISYSDEKYLSPRINMAFEISRNTFLRAGWGYYYQPNLIHEIDIQDKERSFLQSQLAKQYVAGIEHTFDKNWFLKVDAYVKHLTKVNPIFRNFKSNFPLIPELEYDRIKLNIDESVMRGIEFYLKYNSKKINGSISYSHSIAKDKISSLSSLFNKELFSNTFYPRPYDQRNTFYLDLNYTPNESWHFNLSWNYHSGWPYTGQKLIKVINSENKVMYSLIYEKYNNKRFSDYHRMDFRVSHHINTSFGKISLLLELINLYDRENDRDAIYPGYMNSYNEYNVREKFDFWFPFFPSFGINWSYEI